jgi:hypothetical protein
MCYLGKILQTGGAGKMTDHGKFFGIEKRKRRRWELIFFLRVFDEQSGKLLGHVVDIHEEGLMLLSEKPIELNRDYDLALEMPNIDRSGRKKVSLKAHAIWQSADANPDLVDTGFQLINPKKDAVRTIGDLIEELQF